MNSEPDPAAVPPGPPWSLEVIADIHAGMYPPRVEAELRARMAQDREAQAMLSALGSVVDELSILPAQRMPEKFASRLDAAIAAESAARSDQLSVTSGGNYRAGPADPGYGTAPFGSSGQNGPPAGWYSSTAGPSGFDVNEDIRTSPPPRPFLNVIPSQGTRDPVSAAQPITGPGIRPPAVKVGSLEASRRRRRRIIAGLGMAAAVAAIAAVTITGLSSNRNPGSTAAPLSISVSRSGSGSGGPNAVEIDPTNVQAAYPKINGSHRGELANPITYASCLAANDIKGSDVLGVTDAIYQGTWISAIAVAVDATHAEVVIVGQGCGPQGAKYITKQPVDR